MTDRLGWHVPDNLRWLAQQGDRPSHVPLGTLTGSFLFQVADRYEEMARYRQALQAVQQGNVPRPRGEYWRKDRKPSKHDLCIHGQSVNSSCSGCIDEYIESVLSPKPHLQFVNDA